MFPFHPYAYAQTSGNIHVFSVGSLLNYFKPVGNLNHTGKIVRDWTGIAILKSATQWKRISLGGINRAWNYFPLHHITSVQGETFWVSQTQGQLWSAATDCWKPDYKIGICPSTPCLSLCWWRHKQTWRHDGYDWMTGFSLFLPLAGMLCNQHSACGSWAE